MKSTQKIAMKVSEEEYDHILPTLKENGLVEDKNKWSVENCYLLNHGKANRDHLFLGYKNIYEEGISLGTLNEHNFFNYKSDYEFLTYNKELFLQYCGINTEETFEQYTNRVFPYVLSAFLAKKEFKNRKCICTTEDGVQLFGGESIFGVTDDLKLYHTSSAAKENIYRAIIFLTQEAAEKYIADNTPQKTLDGFEIAKGENMWVVSTNFYNLHQSVGGNYKKDNGNHILFKNKENAINYIVSNKTTLSLSDIDFLGCDEERMKLIKKVKQKLGFD